MTVIVDNNGVLDGRPKEHTVLLSKEALFFNNYDVS